MKILAMDSSALTASVAVCEDEKLLGEYTLNNGNTHSENLLPMTESLLKFLDLSVSDIDAFAVSIGPGSFTGIRIGVSTVKGLAFGSDKPCAGVSTLEALAYNLALTDGLICPVMNARRDQVYTALFRAESGKLTRLMPDSAISLSELREILLGYGEPVAFVGDGYFLTAKLDIPQKRETPDRLRHQSAYSVALAALAKLRAGEATSDRELAPVYLRPCQAERERAERLAQESNQT